MYFNTRRLLVPSLGLAPSGRARRLAPGETLLRSGEMRPPVARDDFFTSSEVKGGRPTTPTRLQVSLCAGALRFRRLARIA